MRKTKRSVQKTIDIEVRSSVEITKEEVAVLQVVVDVRTTEGNLDKRDTGLIRHHLPTSREGKADRPEEEMGTETPTTIVDIAGEGTLDDLFW